MPISSEYPTVFNAILSMDAYNRGSADLRKLFCPAKDAQIGLVSLRS
jgi:hypothetical protein